jgi:alkanesulfonate monooxygenase SsuD/methylene tetrahydromethanopterin reductase-like flavin-dependent oxidoreductase (luciferase family)
MAAAVASITTKIRIGLGIMTPLPRHPALTAMEIGALQELSGGRILAGVGAGVGGWMRQMGFDYSSPLTIMREGLELTRRLLNGERVDEVGKVFSMHGVRLGFSAPPPPMLLGAVGPKALELSGEVADGTVLSVLAGPSYVRWARERIAEGQARSGRNQTEHLVVAYAFLAMADTIEEGHAVVRPLAAEYLAAGGVNQLTQHLGLSEEFIRELGAVYARGEIPSEMIATETLDAVAAIGPPERCARWVHALESAGADVVALVPLPTHRASEIVSRLSTELLPQLEQINSGTHA